MASGLYEVLASNQLMIRHEEVANDGTYGNDVYKVLLPEQLPFISHPYEWSYEHWRVVLLAYLKINQISLEHGMLLKDANPFNFAFWGGQAKMIDTSSFVALSDTRNWRAYTQFCSYLLAPLALMHYKGVQWGSLLKGSLRGYDIKFVSRQLPVRSWFNTSVLLHIHLHARTKGREHSGVRRDSDSAKLGQQKLLQLQKMLEETVLNWKVPVGTPLHWEAYYAKDILSTAYLEAKKSLLKGWLLAMLPESVVDLGANTGKFSFLAAAHANRVIALESDERCVAAIERQIKSSQAPNVFVAMVDFSDVPAGLGLMGLEFQSLTSRAQSTCALALALVHHLYIVNRIGFEHMADFFAAWTSKDLLVEFIPVTDDKVQLLLSGRTLSMENYNERNFLKALSAHFALTKREAISDSNRVLFHFTKGQVEASA